MHFFRQKSHIMFILGILLVPFISLIFPIETKAASFGHIHTSNCFSYGYVPCSGSHATITRSETTTHHCTNCGTQTPHTTTVYWDVCYTYGNQDEMGGFSNCQRCGKENDRWGSTGGGAHYIWGQACVCGKDGTPTGYLGLNVIDSTWTTGDVTIGANISVTSGELHIPGEPYSWDGGNTWTSEGEKIITENGTYTIHARNTDGQVISETVVVTNIDRTGPSLVEKKATSDVWTNEDVSFEFIIKDLQPDGTEGSGLPDEYLSLDGGETWTSDNTYTASENQVISLKLRDNLDNVSDVIFEVWNIDKEPPTVKVNVNRTEWTDEEVHFTIEATDNGGSGLGSPAYSLNGEEWVYDKDFVVENNHDYKVYVRDSLDQITVVDLPIYLRIPEPVPENGGGNGGGGDVEDSQLDVVPKEIPEIVEEETVSLPPQNTETSGKQDVEEIMDMLPTEEEFNSLVQNNTTSGSNEIVNIQGEVVLDDNDNQNNSFFEEIINRLKQWLQNPVTRVVTISFGCLILVLLLLLGFTLVCFTVRVYAKDGSGKERFLGRALLRRHMNGYKIKISNKLLDKTDAPRLRLVFPGALLPMVENGRLLVESEGRKSDLIIRESMDFVI